MINYILKWVMLGSVLPTDFQLIRAKIVLVIGGALLGLVMPPRIQPKKWGTRKGPRKND